MKFSFASSQIGVGVLAVAICFAVTMEIIQAQSVLPTYPATIGVTPGTKCSAGSVSNCPVCQPGLSFGSQYSAPAAWTVGGCTTAPPGSSSSCNASRFYCGVVVLCATKQSIGQPSVAYQICQNTSG